VVDEWGHEEERRHVVRRVHHQRVEGVRRLGWIHGVAAWIPKAATAWRHRVAAGVGRVRCATCGDCAEKRREPGTREMSTPPETWQPSPARCERCVRGWKPAASSIPSTDSCRKLGLGLGLRVRVRARVRVRVRVRVKGRG